MPDIEAVLQMREQLARPEMQRIGPGPYLTISRQYGCYGLAVGLLVAEILNTEEPPAQRGWQVYGREVLEELAREVNLSPETVEQLEFRRPEMFADMVGSLSGRHLPSPYRIRRRVTEIVRHLAEQGHAIVIGHGAVIAVEGVPNGLNIRLEAPLAWRVEQLAHHEGVSLADARQIIPQREQEIDMVGRTHIRETGRYQLFDLTYDHSKFTELQIAKHVAYMMKLKGLV